MLRLALMLGVLGGLVGCGSEIVEPSSGQLRTATDPKIVKIYHSTPRKYEVLGEIETTGNLQYGPNKSIDAVMDDLIRQAAAKGGNGVLLVVDRQAEARYATFGGYYQGVFMQFTVRMQPQPEAVIAKAIYSLED